MGTAQFVEADLLHIRQVLKILKVWRGDFAMSNRKYVKIPINTDVTGEYCHKFCDYNSPSLCHLFNQRFDDKFEDFPHNCTHKRLPECKEQGVSA
jgi:hypothetical protein